MQGIVARYDKLASGFYCFYRKFFTNCYRSPYQTYLFNVTRTHFPKLAYNNAFEPEYTRPLVKYNAIIVLSMVTLTAFVTWKTVSDERAKTIHYD
jgi:hypothetical protein